MKNVPLYHFYFRLQKMFNQRKDCMQKWKISLLFCYKLLFIISFFFSFRFFNRCLVSGRWKFSEIHSIIEIVNVIFMLQVDYYEARVSRIPNDLVPLLFINKTKSIEIFSIDWAQFIGQFDWKLLLLQFWNVYAKYVWLIVW